MKDGFRIYDTHTHLGVARHSGRVRRVDDALRAMDANGVDRSVLIPWPVVEDQKAAHDEIGEAVRRYPDRFTGSPAFTRLSPNPSSATNSGAASRSTASSP